MTETPYALRLHDIEVKYRDRPAIQNISGHFKPSSMTAVIGPNGGGKSTLLKVIMGLIPSTKGSISYSDAIKNSVAYLPQLTQIDRNFPMTVTDLVATGYCQTYGFFRRFDGSLKDQVLSALEEVNMQDCSNRTLHSLSGGQFQRVLFARLSLQNASCILLDEPFTAMDSYTISDLVKILTKWRNQGKTLIVVNHDLDLVQDYFPETVLVARHVLGWGETDKIVTLDNLKRARCLSRQLEADYGDMDYMKRELKSCTETENDPQMRRRRKESLYE